MDVERSPSKIGAVKPKVYLTCALRIPPHSWCNLSAAWCDAWCWRSLFVPLEKLTKLFHVARTPVFILHFCCFADTSATAMLDRRSACLPPPFCSMVGSFVYDLQGLVSMSLTNFVFQVLPTTWNMLIFKIVFASQPSACCSSCKSRQFEIFLPCEIQ